jgi:hypothetical protein
MRRAPRPREANGAVRLNAQPDMPSAARSSLGVTSGLVASSVGEGEPPCSAPDQSGIESFTIDSTKRGARAPSTCKSLIRHTISQLPGSYNHS